MSDGSKGEDKAAPESTPPPMAPKVSTWKLPDGIEDHLTKGVVEAGVGMAIGGVLGIVMFTSKSGWRSASVAAGFGVAAGSTFERIRKSYN
mmetsp:Transcript_7808/g.14197  ORF Transcript_7808/g.14197 Transcript_7808/m.14197 type:complete len:91 (-) Transcript_7808:98-370(-)|eukprot:CAMPEP_0202495242 /NCGR_PEP_ID=MMETSP1361-20130828/15796_1 /ASSEMBLY_ACC=CAM_ASM_000849 /TAXON_ID=210615 /ORGANISM="Staurosira complex sp., Strain CCMP2646" /LENGTH=90 /DNA_ID=CAMNT_0049126181 /DNA_START=29 /DNA_END=301 /DNA_ORIENTATION=+